MKYNSPILCIHANETPTTLCECPPNCSCREFMCIIGKGETLEKKLRLVNQYSLGEKKKIAALFDPSPLLKVLDDMKEMVQKGEITGLGIAASLNNGCSFSTHIHMGNGNYNITLAAAYILCDSLANGMKREMIETEVKAEVGVDKGADNETKPDAGLTPQPKLEPKPKSGPNSEIIPLTNNSGDGDGGGD